jgi:hypothetical protein
MARGYAGPPDPDKGKPYRHTQQKIRLMLDIGGDDAPVYEHLLEVILKVAEKRPDDVLDALVEVLGKE